MAINVRRKDPDEVLDFLIDWTQRLDGDVIVTSTWSVPSDLVNEDEENTATTATIWISGGTDGDVYVLTNRVVTQAGRTMEEYFELVVSSSPSGLVSLEAVKKGLKIESEDWDYLLNDVYIPAASKAVIRYLKGNADELLNLDSGGNVTPGFIIPEDIQMAVIVLVGYWFRNPDSDPDKEFEQGFLPRPVTALLYPLRDPALA